jgi:F-type H+-transporting ATPase subunit delta
VTSERTKLESYAHALFEIARGEGLLGDVEDDMFRFARTLEGSDALRLALTDPSLPVERRIGVIEELTGGKALPVSTALLSMLVAAGQASELPQMQRLATALGRATGKDVEVKVIVDPTVLGGLVARIGDTVIDGSVRHRLEQMKERHA